MNKYTVCPGCPGGWCQGCIPDDCVLSEYRIFYFDTLSQKFAYLTTQAVSETEALEGFRQNRRFGQVYSINGRRV